MFKDIILAVTPSEVCECAADTAIAYARRFDAKLYLVHICGIEQGWGSIETLEASGECARIKNNINTYYKDKLEGLTHVEVIVKAGMPHAELLRLVRQKKADLIVMGPHTKEYAERRSSMWGMAGSTLERVSQRATCPVMIVTQPQEDLDFKTLLVATDFSKAADCAVNYGGQMARHYKSELIVFNAHEGADETNLAPDEIEASITNTKEKLREEFEPRMAGIDKVEYECLEGKASTEILKMSRLREADLIILAHHAKEVDPEKALLGSTVVQVALNAGCPTMSVNKHFDLRCGLMYDQSGEAVEEKAKETTTA